MINETVLGIEEIQAILPHRHPMLLIDRVDHLRPGEGAFSYKGVTYNEPFFVGHYPGHPVMPGVFVIEAMAQTGAVAILSHDDYKGKLIFFGGINKAKFRNQVEPGCVLRIEAEITKKRGPIGIGVAKAYADDKLAAEAELTFYIK